MKKRFVQSLIRDIIRLPHEVRVDQDHELQVHDIMEINMEKREVHNGNLLKS